MKLTPLREDSAVREFCDSVDTGLDVVEFIPESVVDVCSERRSCKCRYENCFRLDLRIGYDAVRPLDERRPQTAL